MKFKFDHKGSTYQYDSDTYFDLSTPIKNGDHNVNAYYLAQPVFEPFRAGDFVGSVAQGGACNCETITFNAHGNGTHTECVGHICDEGYTINGCLKSFQTMAIVASVTPEKLENGDSIIRQSSLTDVNLSGVQSVILRSLPNNTSKKEAHYSGTNPTYFEPALMAHLAKNGIKHVIVDLPSVDREEDGGALLSHHAFWQYPDAPRTDATITELAYIDNDIVDGTYLLHIHIASFESDASPSKPILYPISEI